MVNLEIKPFSPKSCGYRKISFFGHANPAFEAGLGPLYAIASSALFAASFDLISQHTDMTHQNKTDSRLLLSML